MAEQQPQAQTFNILIIGQDDRLAYEAALFATSLRHMSPDFKGRLFVAVPQIGPLWPEDPKIQNAALLELLDHLDAEILPFESKHFGATYPYGNKIEALMAMPKGEPFVFFDTDTLVLDEITNVPFDFDRPSASLKREGTWPKIELYGPGYAETWRALYEKFGLDYESSLDLTQPEEYWKRHAYYNAGFFYYKCPHAFGERFLEYALAIRDDGPPEIAVQSLDPWLDQVALPLVIHSFGGGVDALPEGYLDGQTTCHYRYLSLLFARESDDVVEVLREVTAHNKIKKVLKEYEPFKWMIYQNKGNKARDMFDRNDLPPKEQIIRNRLKKNNLWVR